MKLDELFIAFKAEGATELLKSIRTINSALDETVKKYTAVSAQMSRLTAQFQKGINSSKIKDNARKNLSMYEMEIRKLKEIVGLREKAASLRIRGITSPDALAARRMLDSKGAPQGNTTSQSSNTEEATRASILGIAKVATKLSMMSIEAIRTARQLGTQMRVDLRESRSFYNKLLLSGVINRRAVGASIAIARYGGSLDDVLASDRSISTSLGALSRGDTSLIQHLGRFGIGGIMPNMSPEEVRSIITNKVRSKTLSANELNALMAGLPYSDAEKAQMLEGTGSIYSNAYSAFKTKSENDQKLLDAADAQIKGYENAQKVYDSGFYDSVNKIANFLTEQPIIRTLETLGTAITSLVSSLAALKVLSGGLGKGALGGGSLKGGLGKGALALLPFLGKLGLVSAAGIGGYKLGEYILNKSGGFSEAMYRDGKLSPEEIEYRKTMEKRAEAIRNAREYFKNPPPHHKWNWLFGEDADSVENFVNSIEESLRTMRARGESFRRMVLPDWAYNTQNQGENTSSKTVNNNNSTNITNNFYQGDGFRLSDFQDMYSPITAIC